MTRFTTPTTDIEVPPETTTSALRHWAKPKAKPASPASYHIQERNTVIRKKFFQGIYQTRNSSRKKRRTRDIERQTR